MSILTDIADGSREHSLANRLRRRRFQWFQSLLDSVPRPLRILDVGGTERFWKGMDCAEAPGISILILNIFQAAAPESSNIEAMVGDARDLSCFETNSFDIVFSNSVIEHVGGPDDWRRMADEIRRVGKSYFVQTPNRYFPIEPHFLFPFFQFLPREIQILLMRTVQIGWSKRSKDRESAERRIDSVQLLSLRQFSALFPGATLHRERILGLTKSFVMTQSDPDLALIAKHPNPRST